MLPSKGQMEWFNIYKGFLVMETIQLYAKCKL